MGRRGFSLIEMMMAIGVLVILSATAVLKPQTPRCLKQRWLQAATGWAATSSYAQLMAVKQRKP